LDRSDDLRPSDETLAIDLAPWSVSFVNRTAGEDGNSRLAGSSRAGGGVKSRCVELAAELGRGAFPNEGDPNGGDERTGTATLVHRTTVPMT
jgi:hypothetical protein